MNYDKTIKRLFELAKRRGLIAKISKDTGLDDSWLRKVSKGEIANPGVQNMVILSAYFDANPHLFESQEAACDVQVN